MTTTVFLISAAAKATAVFASALLLAMLLRGKSSSARYLVWTCALIAALAVPGLSLLVRPLSVPLPVVSAAVMSAPEAVPAAAKIPASAGGGVSWMWALWLGGALLGLTRITIGHLRVSTMLRRTAPIVGDGWMEMLADVRAQLRIRRTVELRASTETDVPLSYGFLRPEIVIARDSDGWTRERRRVVLTHELVHVRRWDSVWSLLAQIACAVYWFHPLAWLAAVRFRQEQERSCDDAVVRAGIGQTDYAGHLVGVARAVTKPRMKWAAALCMARQGDLEQRVRALLDPRRSRTALSGRALAGALAAIALCILPLAALRGQDPRPMVSLSGSVYDASGAAVPFAKVLLKSTDGSGQEVAQAGAAGAYNFVRIRPGKYNVEVRAPGFAVFQMPGVDVGAGGVEHLDAKLDLGQVMETVEVVGKGPARTASSGAPKRIRVGGNVQATRLVKRVNPSYPVNAQSAGIAGAVLLRAVISTSGDLLNLAVINTADAELAKAATDAVSQWKYQPTLLNGVPVEVVTTITVDFKLEP